MNPMNSTNHQPRQYNSIFMKERISKEKLEGMKNIDDRFEILGLTDIKDYDVFENLGKVNESKSRSLEPMKENRSMSPGRGG